MAEQTIIEKINMADNEVIKVKATEILTFAEQNNVEAFVRDDDDLYPFLFEVSIDAECDTHKCSLNAKYDYPLDDVQHGIFPGYCVFSILGVEFSTLHDDHDSFETSGNEVDYGDMDMEDFWEKLKNLVDIPTYDPSDCNYTEFDEYSVTTEDLLDKMENPEGYVFAVDSDGIVYGFETNDDNASCVSIPKNLTAIEEEEAFKLLAASKQGISYEAR